MSFDLLVSTTRLPEDLGKVWVDGFRRHGFEVEPSPAFDPASWRGGFLPFRVGAAPEALVGLALPDAAVSGFEVSFGAEDTFFRFGSGGPTTEFAMLCLGAALLAEAVDGVYENPQSGEHHRGAAAIDAALAEIRAFVKAAGPRERVHHSFPGWKALGVEV